jgi:hypothetical protein
MRRYRERRALAAPARFDALGAAGRFACFAAPDFAAPPFAALVPSPAIA